MGEAVFDISSTDEWPSCSLSNFADHTFVIDGVECASMEGFLQSLKFRDPEDQRRVCQLIGREAKRAGRGQIWQDSQKLFWQGWVLGRHDAEFQRLITRAFDALILNQNFKRALAATGEAGLDHTIGRDDPTQTVLTRLEFIGQLMRLLRR